VDQGNDLKPWQMRERNTVLQKIRMKEGRSSMYRSRPFEETLGRYFAADLTHDEWMVVMKALNSGLPKHLQVHIGGSDGI
jgi:hypothetical protein